MPLPLVAIVGAPNVGKSTLFNRLVGGRRAIVTDEPGVTRDRLYDEVRDVARPFRLVDTGGLMPGETAPLVREIERQAETALDEASVVLFVVDARAGATALDHDLAMALRRRGCRLLVVANKVDSARSATRVHELHELGLGLPWEISAEHGRGVDELIGAVTRLLPEVTEDGVAGHAVSVAIVGRPNVGKSSLVNRLLGEERVLVSDQPGTTRDAIDTVLQVGERRYRLVDTAGLRRPGKIRQVVERFSVQRARGNIERCDVAVLVLDASASLAAQDAHVAGYIVDALKPMVVVVNKWDLVEEREAAVKLWEERVRMRLRFTRGAPLLFASAVTGQRVLKILDRVDEIHAAAGVRVPTQVLNRWLQAHPAAGPRAGPRAPGFRLYYATQTGVHPPSFVLFCNDPTRAHFSVRRQIENSLRESFGFGPTPIRIDLRGRREAGRK
jgi:GTP-binding protein